MYILKRKEYKTLFDELYIPLCLFSNKYIEGLDASKDIVQDVFVKLWEDKIKFQNENNIKSYLYTSVKNKSLDYLKSKRHKLTGQLSTGDVEHLETESYFLREAVILETSSIIEKAIRTLPNKCANIIRLSYREYTNLEIANELDLSVNTVKTQKKIAYKRLKLLLSEHFILIALIFIAIN